MGIDAEQRQLAGPHLGLEVTPWRIGALGDSVFSLVDDLIQDLQALVGQTHLVGVGVPQQPGNLVGGVHRLLVSSLQPDVSRRLLDPRKNGFELRPDGRHA
jgi:hypothetical protein